MLHCPSFDFCRKQSANFSTLGLVNIAWASSRRGVQNLPLRKALAAASLPTITSWESQRLANTSWANSSLELSNLLTVRFRICPYRLDVHEASGQDLANTAWTLRLVKPIERFTSQPAFVCSGPAQGFFAPQNLVNLVWASSALEVSHQPLFSAISAAARRPISDWDG